MNARDVLGRFAPLARRAAAQERLAETRGYDRRQRIVALRAFLRDPERARRARRDAPEGDERLLYLRVRSALNRLEREERESARAAARLHASHARPRLGETVVENAVSQIAAVLRPRVADHQVCT